MCSFGLHVALGSFWISYCSWLSTPDFSFFVLKLQQSLLEKFHFYSLLNLHTCNLMVVDVGMSSQSIEITFEQRFSMVKLWSSNRRQ